MALTGGDDRPNEKRYVTIGADDVGRILVVVYTCRGTRIRIISARASTILGKHMKKEYDFSTARRGAVIPSTSGKTRITIRLDDEVIAWFKNAVETSGGGNYQTRINRALQEYIQEQKEPLEKVIRRVLREELKRIA